MADPANARAALGLAAAVGGIVLVATLLTPSLETAAIVFSVVEGLLVLAIGAWGAARWTRVPAGVALAVVSLALLAEWWSADYPVNLRRIMIVLGLAGTALGAYAAWTLREPPAA
ncbi:MAG: hypothetical protein QOE90_3066 [Thermoplasmata archaeon]|jgi:hypothetical protein|nr:hypothetical protein [Thermoplasmata archaeon]